MQAFISRYLHPLKNLQRFWKLFVGGGCAILFMLWREIEQWKWSVTISLSHSTNTRARPKWWQNWAIYFLVLHPQMYFQRGWGKSCRCNVILWRCHKSDVLGFCALWRWNSVILRIYQEYLLPLQFSREAVLGFQLITPSVRVLEGSYSLGSNLWNWHFVQAGMR